VQPGDALSTIAQRFGVPWGEIAQANNNIQSISVFEPLVIPGICDHTPAGNWASATTASYFSAIAAAAAYSGAPRYVVIRFDDGYQDQFVNALPVLQEYDLPAAFMTITAAIQNGIIPNNKVSYDWEYMSWQEIQTLYKAGYEIADHSATEAEMNQQTQAGLYYQVVQSRQAMISHGITYIPDFCLPYGDGGDNNTVTSYIYNAGFLHAWNAYPPLQGILNYNTLTTTWYPIDYADNDLSLAQFQSFASQASSSNVVGFEFHRIEINSAWVNSTNPYSITLKQFKQDMSYLKSAGYTVVLPTSLPEYNATVSSGGGALSVSTSEVSMSPGQTVQTTLTVTNTESNSVTLQSLTNFQSSGYPNVVAWMSDSAQLPATLASGVSYKISITVQASSSTQARTYYLTGQINANNSESPTFSVPVSVS